jgi:hypothetical protein
MLWCLITGMHRNAKHSSSVKIHIRKCGFAWHCWRKSPHDVVQYCFVNPRNWSIVGADFLLREVVKKNLTKPAICRWFFINYKVSGHLFKKFCLCFRAWSSWRSLTTGIMFKSSHPALNHLTLSDPTSDLVRQYDFPVLLRCRKTYDTVFVACSPAVGPCPTLFLM